MAFEDAFGNPDPQELVNDLYSQQATGSPNFDPRAMLNRLGRKTGNGNFDPRELLNNLRVPEPSAPAPPALQRPPGAPRQSTPLDIEPPPKAESKPPPKDDFSEYSDPVTPETAPPFAPPPDRGGTGDIEAESEPVTPPAPATPVKPDLKQGGSVLSPILGSAGLLTPEQAAEQQTAGIAKAQATAERAESYRQREKAIDEGIKGSMKKVLPEGVVEKIYPWLFPPIVGSSKEYEEAVEAKKKAAPTQTWWRDAIERAAPSVADTIIDTLAHAARLAMLVPTGADTTNAQEKISQLRDAVKTKVEKEWFKSDPSKDKDFSAKIEQAVGSSLAFMAGGLAGKGLGLSEFLTTGSLGALSQAEQQYGQAEQAQKLDPAAAKKFMKDHYGVDVSEKTANEIAKWGMEITGLIGGASEALPMGHLFQRLDTVTKSRGGVSHLMRLAFEQGQEEALQEALQQVVQNGSTFLLMDRNQSLTEDVVENAFIGFLVGHGMTTVLGGAKMAINAGRPATAPPSPPPGGVPPGATPAAATPPAGAAAPPPGAPAAGWPGGTAPPWAAPPPGGGSPAPPAPASSAVDDGNNRAILRQIPGLTDEAIDEMTSAKLKAEVEDAYQSGLLQRPPPPPPADQEAVLRRAGIPPEVVMNWNPEQRAAEYEEALARGTVPGVDLTNKRIKSLFEAIDTQRLKKEPYKPVPLADHGFPPEEVARLEKAGFATDGAMSFQQLGAWEKALEAGQRPHVGEPAAAPKTGEIPPTAPQKPAETANLHPRYQEAVDIVRKDQKASTSYIQRKLGLGYNQAATIMEQLQANGVVGPPGPTGKREVLPTAGTKAAPVEVQSGADVAKASEVIGTGKGQLAHLKLRGLPDVTLEVAAGGTRKIKTPEGEREQGFTHAYGYFKGIKGADSDNLDVYIGPNPNTGPIFVLDENDRKTGKFRQHKVFAGFKTDAEAEEAYLGTGGKSAKQIRGIVEMSREEFSVWKDGDLSKPVGEPPKPSQSVTTVTINGETRTLKAAWNPKEIVESHAEHVAAIESAIESVGNTPAEVQPVDIQRAAELVADANFVPGETEEVRSLAAFVTAVEENELKPKETERVVSIAVRDPVTKSIWEDRGVIHSDLIRRAAEDEGVSEEEMDNRAISGYMTSHGRFVEREEAARISDAADQKLGTINGELHAREATKAFAKEDQYAPVEPKAEEEPTPSGLAHEQEGKPSGAGEAAEAEGTAAEPSVSHPPEEGQKPPRGGEDGGKVVEAGAAPQPAEGSKGAKVEPVHVATAEGEAARGPAAKPSEAGAKPAEQERPSVSHGGAVAAAERPGGGEGERPAAAAERPAGGVEGKPAEPAEAGEQPRIVYIRSADAKAFPLKEGETVRHEKHKGELNIMGPRPGDNRVYSRAHIKYRETPANGFVSVTMSERDPNFYDIYNTAHFTKAEVGEATKPAQAKSDWTEIGKNHIGQTLYQDQRGVRSYIENGVRHTEPVALRPTRAGMEFSIENRLDEFKTVAESKPAETKVAEKPTAEEFTGPLHRDIHPKDQAAQAAYQLGHRDVRAGTDKLEFPGNRKYAYAYDRGKNDARRALREQAKPVEKPVVTDEDIEANFLKGLEEIGAAPPKAAERQKREAPLVRKTDELGKPYFQREEKPAAEVAKHAVGEASAAGDRFLKGMTELFGGGKTVGMGVNFDKDTYEKAKPYFYDGAIHLKEFMHDVGDLARRMVHYLKDVGKFTNEQIQAAGPYIVQFVKDVKAGLINLKEEVAKRIAQVGGEHVGPSTGGKGEGALEPVAPGEGGATEEGGPPGGEPTRGGPVLPDTNQPPSEGPGLPGARGGGGGVTPIHPPEAGTRGATSALGKKGTGRTRKRITPESARGNVEPQAVPNVPAINFRITEDVGLGLGNLTQKFEDNLNAITILKTLEREERRATPDEQRALARYVGWGGLSNAFPVQGEYQPAWKERGEALAALLTPEEMRQASNSTRAAHYTSKAVVDAMWSAVRRLGYRGGIAHELSVGSGNFLGLIPDDLAGATKFIAIERDSLAARIARTLYPQETVLHSDTKEVPLAEGEGLLSIGNPPFGGESLRWRYKPDLAGLSIHNQFFLAGLDTLAPGGIQAMVVSRYLMDAQDQTARLKIAAKAELLGAFRLAQDAFEENARTQVVTDVIFMQRHSAAEEAEMEKAIEAYQSRPAKGQAEKERQDLAKKVPDWVKTEAVEDPLGGEDMVVNSHYAARPHMILGVLERSGTHYGPGGITVRPHKGVSIEDQLRKAVDRLPQNVMGEAAYPEAVQQSIKRHAAMSEALETALSGDEVGDIKVKDGKVLQVYQRQTPTGWEMARRELTAQTPWSKKVYQDDKGRYYVRQAKVDPKTGKKVKLKGNRNDYEPVFFPDNVVPPSMRLGPVRLARLKQLSELEDLWVKQINLETNNDPGMEEHRLKLAAAYHAYVDKHGLINDPSNFELLNDLPNGGRVLSLEDNYRRAVSKKKADRLGIKPKPATADPAAILSRRVVPLFEPATHADSINDALSIALSDTGKVDVDRIASLLGISKEEAIEKISGGDTPLTYYNPDTFEHETRDEYLTGQVAQKRQSAIAAGLQKNAEDLEKVQPEPIGAENITIHPGATWVPTTDYEDFLKHLSGESDVLVQFAKPTSTFRVEVPPITDPARNNKWNTFNPDTRDVDASLGWLFQKILNTQSTKIMRDKTDEHGNPIKVLDETATELSRAKAQEIANEFSTWIFKDPSRRARLTAAFNEKFNTRVNRQHDGSHLTFPGKVPDAVIEMRRHQKNAIWRGVHERFVLYDHVVGSGKAGSLDSKLLTPSGWIRMGDVKIGDYVITQSGEPTLVEAIFPQGEKEIFKVTFSDGASTECCDEHLWVTQTYLERGYAQRGAALGKNWDCGKAKVRSLAEIRQTLISPHLGAKNHSIPLVEPVELKRQQVTIDPYFLGALIGDGHLGESQVSISKNDDDLFLAFVLPAGVRARRNPDVTKCQTWHYVGIERGNPLLDALRDLSLAGKTAHEKFVPEIYKFNSIDVRLSILRGLMDTDGWVEKNGKTTRFSTASRQLANDVTFLVQSLGGVASETVKQPHYTYNGEKKEGRLAYQLTIKMPSNINPFSLARKRDAVIAKTSYGPVRYIISVESVGLKQAQCIRVAHPSHLYVTDDFIVTHNTFTAIARVMERRRMGISKKPLVIVPNHLVSQWAKSFYQLYPAAKILAANEKDTQVENRRRFFAKIASGDYDAVILPHSSSGFIELSPATEQRFLDEELRLAIEAVREAERAAAADGEYGGFGKPFRVKEAERLRDKIEARIDGLKKRKRDKVATFEQMGIDDLTVDEADSFKNLFYSTKMDTAVRGMGNKSGSGKALGLYMKIKYLQERGGEDSDKNRGGSVAFLTGTPISNSAVEMYTMMRYLAPKDLKDLGLENFDAWRAQYVSASSRDEPTESGSGVKDVIRLGREWSNMQSLMKLYYSFTDSVPQEDINRWYEEDNGRKFPIPDLTGGARKTVVVQPTEAQQGILRNIVARFDNLKNIKNTPPDFERNKERLRLMDLARKVATDARLADPQSESTEVGGKLDTIAKNVIDIYKEWNADAGTQLIFLDRGVKSAKGDKEIIKKYDDLVRRRDEALAANDEDAFQKIIDKLDEYNPAEIEELRRAAAGGWNAYDELKRNLIARGIPPEEIRFVQEANTPAEKEELFQQVRDGQVRVLIGSTPRMGAGTNVQERLVHEHHGDVTWKPSDIEQREGRILRQGNRLLEKYGDKFKVGITAYVTERTIDAKMWDLNSSKLKMVNGIRKYSGAFRMEFEDAESVGMAETAALASGDPLFMERVRLKSEIDKLEMMERAYTSNKYGLEDRVKEAERVIRDYPELIEKEKKKAAILMAGYKEAKADVEARRVTVEGKEYSREFDALTAANQAIEAQKQGDEKAKYSIEAGGTKHSNKEGIEAAVHAALGSNMPPLTVGDKKLISRAGIIEAIAKTPLDEKDHVIGQFLGADLVARASKDKVFEQIRLELSLEKDGITLADVESWSDRKQTEVKPPVVRAVLEKLEKRANENAQSTSAWMQDKIDQAKKNLPILKEELESPFKQEAELDKKRARFQDVIAELTARQKEAEAAGKPPPPGSGIDDDVAMLKRSLAAQASQEILTPRAMQFQPQIQERVREIIRSLVGDAVEVEFVSDEKLADITKTSTSWGSFKGQVAGAYMPYRIGTKAYRGIVYMAINNTVPAIDRARGNMTDMDAFHEAWHVFEDLLANDKELAVLLRETPRLRKYIVPMVKHAMTAEEIAGLDDAEVRAIAFEYWLNNRGKAPIHIGVRGFFHKVMEFSRRLGNFLRGHGFDTTESIFRKVERGEAAEREMRETGGLYQPNIQPKFTIQAVKDFYASKFEPAFVSDRALQADPVAARYRSATAQEKDAIIVQAYNQWHYWNKLPEARRTEFLHRMETRQPQINTTEQAMADQWRKLLDDNWSDEQGWGSMAAFVNEYVPHIWEKPDAWRAFVDRQTKQIGPTWFQKKRTYNLIMDGLNAGLKLRYTNPAEIVTHRLMSGADMRMRMELLHELKGMGLAWEGAQGGKHLANRGWQVINAPDRKQWVIAPDIQFLWKNAVEAHGLWRNEGMAGGIFRGWMGLKNAWVPIKLAVSAFHPLHVLHINQSNEIARGLNELFRGDPEGLRSILSGLTTIPVNLAQAATFGYIQSAEYRQGREAMAFWNKRPADQTPTERAIVELLKEGGFSPHLSEQLRVKAEYKLAEAWQKLLRKEDVIRSGLGTLYHGVRRGMEKFQAPIFAKWIPALKVSAYLKEVAAWMRANPTLASDPIQRRAALRAIGKSIDNRFGEMFYGSLFWDRTLKDASIASFLSLGWNLGFVREFGGAALEAAVIRPRGLFVKPTQTRKTILGATNKISFVLTYVGTAMLINAVMNYFGTGNPPEDVWDVIFPRIGGNNPDGTPRRITNMFYLREIPMLIKHKDELGGNWATGALAMIWNKLMFQPIAEAWNNRNYWGYNIWDVNAPIYKQIMQGAYNIGSEQLSPISLSGASRAADISGKPLPTWRELASDPGRITEFATTKGVPLAIAGFGPAPAYAEKTAIQARIGYLYGLRNAGSKPEAEGELSTAKFRARSAILAARTTHDSAALSEAIKKGRAAGLSEGYMARIGTIPTDVYLFSRLPKTDQEAILRDASPDERKKYLAKAKQEVQTEFYRARPKDYTGQPLGWQFSP